MLVGQKVVHKKYTFKNGKLYGPYLYENKRVGGKVVTTYVGKEHHWMLAIAAAAILLAALSAGFFWLGNFSPTGNVALDIGSSYNYGEQLDGTLKLSLKQGELLPADTIVRVRNGNHEQSILLSALLSQSTAEGTFYAEGTNIAGSGTGYGLVGSKASYPALSFELLISSSSQPTSSEPETNTSIPSSGSSGGSSSSENEPATQSSEPVQPTQPTEPTPSSGQPEQPQSTEPSQTNGETASQTPAEQPQEQTPTEAPASTSTDTTSTQSGSSETSSSSSESAESSSSSADSSSSSSSSESSGSSGSESSSSDSSSGSTITGAVIGEDEYTVSGKASKGSAFTYNLEDGQSASIVGGSVKTEEGEQLSDSEVSLSVSAGKAEVTTDYEISESGFGQEYIGDEEVSLSIDLSKFGINVTGPEVEIALIYGSEEIVSASKAVSVVGGNGTTAPQPAVNETDIIPVPILNDTNATIPPVNITLNDTNVTIPALNETLNLSITQIRSISTVRLAQNGSAILNLSEYFSGAESFTINVADVIAAIDGETLTLTAPEGFYGARQGRVSARNGSETLESNAFNILVSKGIAVTTFRDKIVAGEQVRWVKSISLDEPQNLTVELPAAAENVTVKSVDDSKKEKPALVEMNNQTTSLINANVVAEFDTKKEGFISKFFRKLFSSFTGRAIDEPAAENKTIEIKLADNATQYTIEYYTPAPQINETLLENGKQIVISAGDNLNYTDVIAFTNLSFPVGAEQLPSIKLYWDNYVSGTSPMADIKNVSEVENTTIVEEVILDANGSVISAISESQPEGQVYSAPTMQEMPFDIYDLDFDGQYDYIEWVVPHLSSQSFTLVMNATNTLTSNITFTGTYASLTVDRSAAPYDKLVGYWPFDTDNSTNSFDLSGNGLNGSYSGVAYPYQNTSCSYGGCAYFNGANGLVSVPDSPRFSLEPGVNFSINFWIKPNAYSAGCYMTKMTSGGLSGYHFYSSGNSLFFKVNNDSTTVFDALMGSYTLPRWVMSTVSVNRTGNCSLYTNGALVTSTSCASWANTNLSNNNVLYLSSFVNPSCFFNGSLDEVMIFNTSLSSAEISAIYSNQSTRFVTQGLADGKPFNISSGDLSMNITVDDFKRNLNTNVSVRAGRWDVSQGYNNTGSSITAYYHADGNGNDASGNGYTAGLSGVTLTNQGVYNNSFYFDGSSSYASLSTWNSFMSTSTGTMSMWVKPLRSAPSVGAAYSGDVIIGDTGGYMGILQANIGGQDRIWVYNYDSNEDRVGIPYTVGQWIHVTWKHSGGNLYAYKDGLLVGSVASGATGVTGNTLQLGDAYGTPWNGLIDEVILSSSAWTDEQIKENYIRGRANWDYTPYQNFTQLNATRSVNTFEIKNTTTNVLPSFAMTSGNRFYTSYLSASNIYPWNFTFSANDMIAPSVNFTHPTPSPTSIIAASNVGMNISSSDVQIHHTISDFDRSLALWLRMDSVNASNNLVDSSSYNSTVTAIGGATFEPNGGKIGGSFRFYGNASYLRVKDNLGLRDQIVDYGHNVSKPYGITLSAWVKYNGTQNAWSEIIGRDFRGDGSRSDPWGSYRLLTTEGSAQNYLNFCLAIDGVGNSCVQSPSTVSSNVWHHIVGMYNGTHQSIFVDGTRVAISGSVKGAITSAYQPFADTSIASVSAYAPEGFFNGSADEIMIFSRGLTEAEIRSLYNATAYQYQQNMTVWPGRHTVTGYAIDESSNVGSTETRTFYTDVLLQNASFINPTPANGSNISQLIVNASIAEDNLQAVMFNLNNGANYTIFNDSVTLFLSFDNRSALGEDKYNIVDVSPYNHHIDFQDEGSTGYNGFSMFKPGRYGGYGYYTNNSANGLIVRNDLYQVLPYNSSFTISLWFKKYATDQGGLVTQDVNNQGDYLVRGYRFTSDTNGMSWWSTQNNGTLYMNAPKAWANDTWYHAVISYNPNPNIGSQMYIDGALVASDDGYIVPSPSVIGISPVTSGYGELKGVVDDIIILNTSVSAAQAKALYNSNLFKFNNTQWYFYYNSADSIKSQVNFSLLTKDSSDIWNMTTRTFNSNYSGTYVDNCGVLNASGPYMLSHSLASADFNSWGCLNITASDVDLDCDDNLISDQNQNRPAISIYGENVTVRNCIISLPSQMTSTNAIGIYLYPQANKTNVYSNTINRTYVGVAVYSSDNLVKDNIFNNTYITAFYAYQNSRNNIVLNNSVRSGNVGLRAENSYNNTFINNNVSSVSQMSYYLLGSGQGLMNNTIVNNTATGGTHSLYLWSASGNYIIGNNFSSASTAGTYTVTTDAGRNVYANNTIRSSQYGIYISGAASSNNFIQGNNISSITQYGIYLSSSMNNTVTGNILDSAWRGILASGSHNNTIHNNILTRTTQYGILVSGSQNVSTFNNTASYSGISGIYYESTTTGGKIINNTVLHSSGGSPYGAIYLSGADYNILGNNTIRNSTSSGLYLSSADYNNISNTYIDSSLHGIRLENAYYNSLSNISVTNTTLYGIYFSSATAAQNNFTNVSIEGTNASSYDLYISAGTSGLDYNMFADSLIGAYTILGSNRLHFRSEGDGMIKFLSGINGTGANLSADIQIRNNYAYVNESIAGLNRPANITLNNVSSINRAFISRSGVRCPDYSCWNFTPLYGDVVFNVTGWSNYSIANVSYGAEISFVQPTPYDGARMNLGFYTNTSMLTDYLGKVIMTWNSTNYTFYSGDLMRLYNLDNRSFLGENSTYVVDSSLYGGSGTVTGAAYTPSGKYAGAYTFDGVGDYIQTDYSLSSGDGAVGVWFKASAQTADGGSILRPIVSQGDFDGAGGANPQGILISMMYAGGADHGKLRFDWGTDDDYYMTTARYNDSQWHHAAMSKSGTTVSIYVDGQLLGTNDATNSVDSSPAFSIGGSTSIAARMFNGSIDNVQIWNRSMTASEMRMLYDSVVTQGENEWYLQVQPSGVDNTRQTYQSHVLTSQGGFFESTEERDVIVSAINISFVYPTPADNTVQPGDSIYVNMTTNSTNTHFAFLDFDRSLLLWMTMDDLNATGHPVDMGTWGNNGTIAGNAAYNYSGKFGRAFSFDGDGDYLNLGTLTANYANYTQSAWIYKTGAGDYAIFGNDDGSYDGHALRIGTGNALYIHNCHSTPSNACNDVSASSAGGLALNNWTHVAVTVQDGSATFYVNGAAVAGGGAGVEAYGTTLEIGRDGYSAGFFNGSIDEAMMFNRTLNAAEIASLYNASANRYYRNFTGLGDGVYTFRGWTVDTLGNRNATETRAVVKNMIYVSNCMEIEYPVRHVLSRSISDFKWYGSNWGCINVTTSNAVIDCAGYSIINASTSTYGGTPAAVMITGVNTTIMNCPITQYSQNSRYGIYLYSTAENSTILNNTVNTSEYGIYLLSAKNARVINNTVIRSRTTALVMGGSSYNNVMTGNTLNGTAIASYVVYISGTAGNNNTLAYNYIANGMQDGLYLTSATSNNIIGNTIINNTRYGIYSYQFGASRYNVIADNIIDRNKQHGIFFDGYTTGAFGNANNNNITNNTIRNNLYSGIASTYGSYNFITNNTIYNNSHYGIYGYSQANANNISDNIIVNNSKGGIYLDSSSTSNTIADNIVDNNSAFGIELSRSANYNTIVNNTVSDHILYGIFINTTVSYARIYNNTVFNNTREGIYLLSSNDRVNVSYNHVYSNGGDGLNLTTTNTNILVFNNTFRNNSESGASISSSTTNTFSNNRFESNGLYGLYTDSNLNTFMNSTFTGNALSGLYLGYPAGLRAGKNVVMNNILMNNSQHGAAVLYSDNNTFINNTFRSNNLSGLYLFDSKNNTIKNLTSLGNYYGVQLDLNAQAHVFNNITINGSRQAGIYMYNTGNINNNFTNAVITNTDLSKYDLYVTNASSDGNYFIDTDVASYTILGNSKLYFLRGELGEIRFLTGINGTGANLSGDIQIKYNYAYVNDSRAGLNMSANITLYNLPAGGQSILRDGVACPASICTALTGISGSNVVFNVTGWSSYSIGGELNCSAGCVIVRNSTGSSVAAFDKQGNLFLKGSLTQNSVGSPNGRDLVIKDSAGNNVAWIDGATGNMRLASTAFQGNGVECTTPSSSFAVKNTSGNCVAYINRSGSLWLKGGYYVSSNLTGID